MKHVVFARDRRKRRSRLKGLLFFMALISILIGIVLALKPRDNPTSTPSGQYVSLTDDAADSVPAADSSASDSAKADNSAPDAASKTEAGSSVASQAGNEDHLVDLDEVAKNEDDDDPNVTDDANATSYDDFSQEPDDEAEIAQAEDELEEGDALSSDAENALKDLLDVADQAKRISDQFSHTVVRGERLRDVLELSGLSPVTARVLTKKDGDLANLKAGQQFYWVLDNNGNLEYLNWLVSDKEERIYERTSRDVYARKVVEKKGEWRQDVLKGTLNGSFDASLRALGLSQRQISQLTSGLQWQISTTKLKKGDRFAILVRREYINGKVTELGNVEAIHIISGNKSYYAIQAENGRYYSRHGETLGKGFARYPLQSAVRVSSSFNPARRHPITKRIRPHKGVDFALPTGTPIIAPADGRVEKIAYQAKGAGRYVVLRHGREYSTVYMHLSKVLVKAGQTVRKGERIALSGNTGASTGPHLHYEFHINDRPVNPMTVRLPGSGSGMPDKERKNFLVKAKAVEAKLRL